MRSMLPRALRWFALVGLLSVVGSFAFPSTAEACSCRRRSVADAVKDAAVVFEGTSLASYEGRSRQQVLRVEKVYKGQDRLGQLAGVSVLGKDTSCEMTLQLGKRYLVYAHARGHALTVALCSRTKEIASADEDLDVLEAAAFRRRFDLTPTPDRDWLGVELAPAWAFPEGRVRRVEVTVEPTGTPPTVPISAVLAVDLSVTGAQRTRAVEVARATIDAMPNGAHLAIVGLAAPNVVLLESTAVDEHSRADMHAKLDALPTGKPTPLASSAWLAAAQASHAPFEAAARFVVVASAGGSEDAKQTAEERARRLERAANRIRHEYTEVTTFSLDDTTGARNLETLAEVTKGRFHSASVDVQDAVATDIARWRRVVGGLAMVELELHGDAEIVGAQELSLRRSRKLGQIHIGNLFAAQAVTRTLYLDIPEGLEPGAPVVSVRLRYLDPSGTSAQAVETVELEWSEP